MANIKNIPLKKFRKFLENSGCKMIRTNGGHETWTRKDFLRPITIQSHIDPIPERIVRQALKTLKIERKDFEKMMDKL